MEKKQEIQNDISVNLLKDLREIIARGRAVAYAAVNAAMIDTYWKIGQRIVEEEQHGKRRAEYGTGMLNALSAALTAEFGKGFEPRKLRDYRQFYLYFPQDKIWHSRVPNLTWTHFRTLLRVPEESARLWYLDEASRESWSVRTLDRNISSQYYHRLLASQNKAPVVAEMKEITAPMQADKLEFIKNPVVAEFLGLASNPGFTETKLEKSIISHLQNFLMASF